HFYIFLPILLLFLVKTSSIQRDPFRALPWIVAVVAVLCIAFRATSVCFGTPNDHTLAASHNRMDALFFGVLLGYFYHFRPQVLDHLLRPVRNRVVVAACSAALLSMTCLF